MKFSDFRKGDLVFSDENKRRVWTVVETSADGVKLLCTHFRVGDRVGGKLDEVATVDSFWYHDCLSILHIVGRQRARVV